MTVIAGMDPTGGAGVWRDAWTLRAVAPALDLRVVVTALTRQGHGRRARAHGVASERLADQLRARASDGSPAAIKIGLVPEALTEPLAEWLAGQASPVVLDPVLAASDGGALGASAGGYATLARGAVVDLVTPNGGEAVALLDAVGAWGARETVDAGEVAGRLAERLGVAVLLKGGHALATGRTGAPRTSSTTVTDVLVADGRLHRFERPRVAGPDVRGTGCALASAIAGRLALGDPLVSAVAYAVAWLDEARQGARAPARPGPPDARLHLP